ncbi:hypothetical protein [Methanoplanus limicola]|uniref:PGF-CTERM sorting domain-containing protein n=1 Tax=Methanoplanus limicola DSM 2279 TaxID=937775 RepID=H1YYU2_9EURY|nr:hypothetical protein [Methanoplanus limicola]EHQ37014.1 hypothetical protein Metlim_2982 [Methanoplanus limicola DSM 2279]
MKNYTRCVLLLLTVSLLAVSASAVILEENYKGKVSRLEPSKQIMTMQVSEVYEGGKWVPYAKSSLKNNIVAGSTDNPHIYNELKQGDLVEACILGGAGGEWVAIGKISSATTTESRLTMVFGDPAKLLSPYYDGYSIEYTTTPNCNACEGTICAAPSATVTVYKGDRQIEKRTLAEGMTRIFGYHSDNQYVLKITYNFGEASSSLCPGAEMMTGPQDISDFTIYDMQRSAILAAEIPDVPEETTATEAPTAVQTEVPETPAPPVQPTPSTTSSPGFAGFAAMGGVAAAFILLAAFRRD